MASDDVRGVAFAEWEEQEVPGVELSARDLRLAERLRGRSRDAAVDVRPSEGGVLIRTQGAVGVVRFNQFELRIEPKLPGSHLGLFRMIDYATGLTGIAQLAGRPGMHFAGDSLVDLVIRLLAWHTERLVKAGLRADYVTHEGDLPALRGRLLADRQVLDRLGIYDAVVCRYDEHEHDVPDNRLLALALGRGARVARVAPVRRRALALAALLEEVCRPESFDPGAGRSSISYDRMNEHYRDAHELAWLVLEGIGPDDDLASGPVRARSFLIDMNELFERFVERALRDLLGPAFVVQAQRTDSIFWDADHQRRYARVRPDLLIERQDAPRARMPVDAKYKRYGSPEARKIDVGDLSQAFLYAYAYRDPDSLGAPTSVLIYPSERGGEPDGSRLEVRSVSEQLVEAKLYGLGVHIPTLLDELDGLAPPASSTTIRKLLTALLPADPGIAVLQSSPTTSA